MTAKKIAYHHGNLRETLIKSAVQILIEGTVQDLSLRALARKAGVSQTAPYRHFADKESLLAALILDGVHKMNAKVDAVIEKYTYPPLQLKQIGMAYYDFSVEFPSHFNLLFEQRDTCGKSKYKELIDSEEHGRSIVEGIVERCLDMKGAKKIDLKLAYNFAWSMTHGISALMLNHTMDDEAPTTESKLFIVDGLTSFFAASLFDIPIVMKEI